MSLFTNAVAALTGHTLIMANDVDSGTGLYTDYVGGNTLTAAGSPTVGGATGPCTAETYNKGTTLNGTTQWWDCGTTNSLLRSGITAVGTTGGMTVAAWVRVPSGSTGSASSLVMASFAGGGNNGFGVDLNTSVFEAYEANTITLWVKDNSTGFYTNAFLPPQNEACNWDGWVFLNAFLASNALRLRINGASIGVSSTRGSAIGATVGASMGKWAIGGYGLGSSILPGFRGTMGPTAAFTGELTEAEEQSLLLAGPTKYLTAPCTRFLFRNLGTDMLTASSAVATQGDVVAKWKNVGSTSAVVPEVATTAGADYSGPKRSITYNGLAYNNLWQAQNSPDTGAPYQMGLSANSGIPKMLSNVGSMWFACRPIGTRTLSTTSQTLVALLSAGTVVASLIIQDDRVVFLRGATAYDATSVPFARTAPSLCAVGLTYAYGVVKIHVMGSSGTATAPANSTSLIDEIYIGGKPQHFAGAGTYDGMLSGFAYTGGHSEVRMSDSAMQSLLASLYSENGNGDLQSPTVDVVIGGDSIGGGQNSTDCLAFSEVLSTYFHGPSFVNRSHPSDKMANTLAIGWSSARLWSASSTTQYVMVQTIRNDITAGTARASVKADLTSIITAARSTKPNCKLIVLGCTPGDSTLQASQATARANYETDARDVIANNGGGFFISLESMTSAAYYVADHIHLTNAGHAEMARLVANGMASGDPATFHLAGSSRVLLVTNGID